MRSTTKYLLTAGTLTLASLALIPSCASNDSSLFVVGVLDVSKSTCIAKADTSEALLAGGTLDIAFAQGYTAFVLVGNQLTQRGSREQLRTETSRVSLRGAEVRLTNLDGSAIAAAPRPFSTVGTGFVDAASGDAPSYAAMAVNLIPPGLTGLPGEVLAKIRVFGDTLGGTSVTSSELDFPITVCKGCLVQYPAAAADPAQAATAPYKCSTTVSSASSGSSVAAPCFLGQDVPFSCLLCSSAYEVCRDPCLNPSYAANCPPP